MAQRKMTVTYNTDRARWEAVLKRDRAAGNAFVSTVSSTGIYCRPTCPARVARRANVGFYEHASEAAALGYRPCKRCKPELAEGQPEDAAITAIKNFVASAQAGWKFGTLREMADEAGLSKWHFHRTFVKVVGMTPGEWVKQQKQMALNSSTATRTISTEPLPLFDFASSTSPTSSAETKTPSSIESMEDLDQLFNGDFVPEDEWLNMIDFEALSDSLEWNSFGV